MCQIVIVSGSPSERSKSAALAEECVPYFRVIGLAATHIRVRDLPAENLVHGAAASAEMQAAIQAVDGAQAVIISTPIYKAAYSGVLKAFLDLLPQKGLAHKIVLPIATSGSPAHLLAIDYALRPVLSALGARNLMHGILVSDSLAKWAEDGQRLELDPEIRLRLAHALGEIALHLLDNAAAPDSVSMSALAA